VIDLFKHIVVICLNLLASMCLNLTQNGWIFLTFWACVW